MDTARILIIDDDKKMCEILSYALKKLGHVVDSANTRTEGVQKSAVGFDVVYLDVYLPDGNGLEILSQLRETESSPEVIIFTGYADLDGAELAMKNGAWDYVEKPASVQALILPFLRAMQYRREKRKKKTLLLWREKIIGNSSKIKACLEQVAVAANNDANVLISGETGTGKELFAMAIHRNSERAQKNFVVVDCTALPETLVESLLFGHEKGAYTGADTRKEGLIQQADGGTLFLDEIGELPLSLQKTFLRVIQERRFRPVGSSSEKESNFRLIAATNKNLDEMVRNGTFRQDLLFRLRSIPIELPPLRERLEDIKEIAMYYIFQLGDRLRTETKGFSVDFFEVLAAYSWPGNVRELLQALNCAFYTAGDDRMLFPIHLPPQIRIQQIKQTLHKNEDVENGGGRNLYPSTLGLTFWEHRDASEKQYLQNILSSTGGDGNEACRLSGLSRSYFYKLIKKHQLGITM